jgi:hypothetical protein
MNRKSTYSWALLAIALLVLSCSAPSDVALQNRGTSHENAGSILAAQNGSATSLAPAGESVTRKRWLIICLDGVPLSIMQSLWKRGYFHEFAAPSAAISSLPSDTETALTEALHAMSAPGYEHDYYDRAANRMRGGALVTISGAGIPYIQTLDYDTNGWFKILSYLAPRWVYRSDLRRFNTKFQASHAPVFVAHVATSDALLHVRTAEQADPLLIEFDSAVRKLYGDAHGELGIIVFSDHGNTQTLSESVSVESFLASRGWRIRDSLSGPRDVVIPSYGLVGFAAIYCQPELVEHLAEDLRGVQGADFIFSGDPAHGRANIRAAGSDSTALLEWSPDGRRYRYTAHSGDPLGLAPAFDDLRVQRKLDSGGFAKDEDLLAATASSRYPDSAARIRAWATNHVRNRADVLISFKPGYDHGSRIFSHIVKLVGTHGGLEKSASLGFAMATYPLAPSIRLEDLLPADLLDKSESRRQR